MANQFIITKTLSAGANEFSFSGVTQLDMSNAVTKITQSVKKQLKPINMPKSRGKWGTNLPETRFYDFKRMTDTLTVSGSLSGDNAETNKNKLIAMVQDGGPLTSLTWNGETFSSTDEMGQWWITNLSFTDTDTVRGNMSTTASNQVKYDFTMNLTRAVNPQ